MSGIYARNSAIEECPFFEANHNEHSGSAHCRLLKRIFRTEDHAFSNVDRDACDACCQTDFPNSRRYNSVIASLVHAGACRVIDLGGVAGCDVKQARGLQDFAVSEITRTTLGIGSKQEKKVGQTRIQMRERMSLYSCDVIVCCSDASDQTAASIDSIVNQRDVLVNIHLVDNGGDASEVSRRFGHDERFMHHRNEHPVGLFSTLAKLLPDLRSSYVAFQDPMSISRPDRLKRMIDLLEHGGGEMGASAVETLEGKVVPEVPASESGKSLPWQSTVVRRTTLLDLQRLCAPLITNFASLVRQTVDGGRQILLEDCVTVDIDHSVDAVAEVKTESKSHWHHPPARDSSPRPAVDVVLPFRNTIDFVYESLQSVFEQTGVDVVVHLVDDASSVDTSLHLDRWRSDPRIRVYRNTQNVGPYVSFNNVSRYFETEFVAIQDADDISLPHRLSAATTSLRDSNADIFGGAVEMFGDIRERVVNTDVTTDEVASCPVDQFRYSRYPVEDCIWYFIINPTMVMRVSTFNRLGGFADYGDPSRNRCGLDSEFYTRARFAGCKFFVSREVVLKHRRHSDSLTQNDETGWGSPSRNFARRKLFERIDLYRNYDFDPQDFGSRDRYFDLTERML